MNMLKEENELSPEIWGGIECTINRVNDRFFDQLNYADYYRNSRIDEISDLGIKKVRFPVLWERHQPTLETDIDWTWAEGQLNGFKDNGIDVIAGLVHHGSGPKFTNLLDEKFPELLAAYAKKVATKFPWLKYYTPVNEPLTTARFSGLYGFWYPHKRDDKDFLLMLVHQLKGVVLSMQEIRKINPAACLVQTEDLGKTYSTPLLRYQAALENERRWLTYDLLCGHVNEKHKLWKYFEKFSIPTSYLEFFLQNPCTPDVFGYNYYITSERYLDENTGNYPVRTRGGNCRHRYADVEVARVEIDQETGLRVLLKEAWDRYQKPIAMTEVHLHCHREEQLRWFKYVYQTCKDLMQEGVDIKGITSWAILGSFGWNKLLTRPGGTYEAGAYDLRGGTARPTAVAAYIKNITGRGSANHHLTIDKGWWQRDSRLIFRKPFHTKLITQSPGKKPVLILGKTGTLGRAFARTCTARMIPYVLLSREQCDITDTQSIQEAIAFHQPWAVINATGYVRVDDAEEDIDSCFLANAEGAANLAQCCHDQDIQLVTFSSDLVFDGSKKAPYVESDLPNPLNVYGKSKMEGEKQVSGIYPSSLIIRTSAFFSPWDNYNFLHWVEQSLEKGIEVPVANDIYVSPTYVPDLVHNVLDLLIDKEQGIWHLANKGSISWADLAYVAARRLKLSSAGIKAIPASHIGYAAPRPSYGVLGTERGQLMPSLGDALGRYFHEKKLLAAVVK
ncbi:MAG TPA: family 1 glycosylhydrolase [Flavisolibacter sp.]|nr:family 1 glycosylhydrolase [Flavisolibacter sp.]